MSDVRLGIEARAESDTGLDCLVMLARFHNIAASPEQLAHDYLTSGQLFGKTELLQAAKETLKKTS